MEIHTILNATSVATSFVALLTGWRYYYRFERTSNQWGWLVMMIGLLSITAAEVADTYSAFHLEMTSELADFFGIIAEVLLTIGFVRLFSHELAREKIEQQKLTKSLENSEELRFAGLEITSSLNMEHTLQALLRRTTTLSGADLAAIYLCEENGNQSGKYYATCCNSGKMLFGNHELEPFTRQILETSEPLLFENLSGKLKVGSLLPIATLGGFPLQERGIVLGILFVGFIHAHTFSDEQQLLLSGIAEHGALAFRNALLYKQVETLSLTDALTGLSNRRSFDQTLEKELERARRYDTSLSLVILDIDHFKVINDTWGHPAGDFVLKRVSDMLRQNARIGDFAARVGGEEMALILPNTDPTQAEKMVERLRTNIHQMSFTWKGNVIQLTCSFGIAGGKGIALPGMPTQLYQQSDEALYTAKIERNCIKIKW